MNILLIIVLFLFVGVVVIIGGIAGYYYYKSMNKIQANRVAITTNNNNVKIANPQDAGWCDWDDWSPCDEKGMSTRNRKCGCPESQNGGKNCDGQSSETRQCGSININTRDIDNIDTSTIPQYNMKSLICQSGYVTDIYGKIVQEYERKKQLKNITIKCSDGSEKSIERISQSRLDDMIESAHRSRISRPVETSFSYSSPNGFIGANLKWDSLRDNFSITPYKPDDPIPNEYICKNGGKINGIDFINPTSDTSMYKSCVAPQLTKPINGGWCTYDDKWSYLKGTDTDIRYRSCKCPEPQYGGDQCIGSNEQTRPTELKDAYYKEFGQQQQVDTPVTLESPISASA